MAKRPDRGPERSRVWFGPPDIGAERFVRQLDGLDLTNWPLNPGDRVQLAERARELGYYDINGADTDPKAYDPAKFVTILVLPDEAQYRLRRNTSTGHPDYYADYKAKKALFDVVLSGLPQTTIGAIK